MAMCGKINRCRSEERKFFSDFLNRYAEGRNNQVFCRSYAIGDRFRFPCLLCVCEENMIVWSKRK